jgi:hypothetical protein
VSNLHQVLLGVGFGLRVSITLVCRNSPLCLALVARCLTKEVPKFQHKCNTKLTLKLDLLLVICMYNFCPLAVRIKTCALYNLHVVLMIVSLNICRFFLLVSYCVLDGPVLPLQPMASLYSLSGWFSPRRCNSVVL